MDATLIIAVALSSFLLLALARVPIAFALGIAGALGIGLLNGFGVAHNTLGSVPYNTTGNYSLVLIPMFILMGSLMARSGIASEIFDAANRLVGPIPGGLAVGTVIAATIFGGITGSSAADVAAIGRIAIGEMTKRGYSARFSAGVVAASGTIAILIPPSIVLIVYGILTTESIAKLMLAGIVPGLISATFYIVSIVVRIRFWGSRHLQPLPIGPGAEPAPAPPRGAAPGDRRRRVLVPNAGLIYAAILFAVVIGGIYTGTFTATEAGAMGAFVALILTVLHTWRKRISPGRTLVAALLDSASLTGMIFALLIGAAVFTFFLVSAGVPTAITGWALALPVAPLALVAIFLVVMVPLGMVLEGLTIMLVMVPLTYPIVVTHLGFSGIWYGILVVKTIEIGLLMPPLGLNAYVVAALTKGLKVEDAFRGVMPFILVETLLVVLFFFVPGLVTWLPSIASTKG